MGQLSHGDVSGITAVEVGPFFSESVFIHPGKPTHSGTMTSDVDELM
jgi:hypothetical protein